MQGARQELSQLPTSWSTSQFYLPSREATQDIISMQSNTEKGLGSLEHSPALGMAIRNGTGYLTQVT